MVKRGVYSSRISHYSILHTIEKMYGLSYIGDSLTIPPVTNCWKGYSDSTATTDSISYGIIYPNPNNGLLYVKLSDYEGATAEIYNLNGKLIQYSPLESSVTSINTDHLVSGLYLIKIKSKEGIFTNKLIRK
jgi:hypothetical protein